MIGDVMLRVSFLFFEPPSRKERQGFIFFIGQDLQDFLDLLLFSQFPDETVESNQPAAELFT